MKAKFLHLSIVVLSCLSVSLQSCSKEDEKVFLSLPNAVVTIRPQADEAVHLSIRQEVILRLGLDAGQMAVHGLGKSFHHPTGDGGRRIQHQIGGAVFRIADGSHHRGLEFGNAIFFIII